MMLLLFSLSVSLSPLVLGFPLDAGTPGDPGPLDFFDPKDSTIHIGISSGLLDTFKLVSQYAAAAYCADNTDSPDTFLTCPTKNCPLVEAAGVVTLSEFEDTPKFDDTGYIGIDDTNRVIVLAIRGSVSDQNWQADYDMIRTKINFCHDCHVHRGFKNSWGEIKDAVMGNMKKAVARHPHYRIIVTGHSLGGAVATLAAAELRRIDDHFLAATELYTFGSPRLANKEAARWLTGQSHLSWRITNEDDVVPRLPPRFLGYHHVLPEYWIPRNGDDPDNEEIEWASREDSSWGNEGELTPKRASHSHYFGPIGACKGGSGDRIGVPQGLVRRAGNTTSEDR